LQFSLKRLKPLLLHFSVFMKKIAQKKTSWQKTSSENNVYPLGFKGEITILSNICYPVLVKFESSMGLNIKM
jgi:hypothetical protein